MEINRLYIDETGQHNGNIGYYILVGCSIRESKRTELNKLAGQIKYKYWGSDSITFHSQEIGKCIGQFNNLKDLKTKEEFNVDLFKLLNYAPIVIFPVILKKFEVSKRNWSAKTKLRTVARSLFRNFIIHTISIKGCTGKIVIEASSLEKDYYYHEALNHFKSNGIPELKISGADVSKLITSISFVNKSNGDIEEQLADILAYGVTCQMREKDGRKYAENSYEKKLVKILENKKFKIPENTTKEKKKLLKAISSFTIIPE